jgi:RNA polymerase sigma factor (sigma-70 family)
MPSSREISWEQMDGLSEAGGMRKALDNDPFDQNKRRERKGSHHFPQVAGGSVRPRDELEACMVARPFEEPQTSVAELLPLRDILQDAIDGLPEREAYVLNACIIERLSLREVGEQLSMGKSNVAKIRERALALLREALADTPLIAGYLEGQA